MDSVCHQKQCSRGVRVSNLVDILLPRLNDPVPDRVIFPRRRVRILCSGGHAIEKAQHLPTFAQGTVVAHPNRVAYTARRSLEQTVSDDQVQRFVEDALDWADPTVDGSRIGVTVDKGVVTLRGTVDTPSQRLTAERVAQRVRGVETVINHLAVSSHADTGATHREVAHAGARASATRRALGGSPRRSCIAR